MDAHLTTVTAGENYSVIYTDDSHLINKVCESIVEQLIIIFCLFLQE